MLTCGLSSEFASVIPQAEGADVIDDPENETLLDIQSFLEGFNFTMDTYGLPTPVSSGPPLPRLQREEMRSEAQRQELQSLLDANLPTLSADQRNVYDTVLFVMADQSSPQVRLMRHRPALVSWDRMLSRTLTFVCAPCSVCFSWMVQVAPASPSCIPCSWHLSEPEVALPCLLPPLALQLCSWMVAKLLIRALKFPFSLMNPPRVGESPFG